MSYAMRGGYTLGPIAYGIHNRAVQLVDLIGSHLGKIRGKIYIPRKRFDQSLAG